MELDVVAKAHSDTIKDSTLCGMSLDDFYKAMVSVVFPGYTTFYAEDTKSSEQLDFSPDDIASMLYSARAYRVKRTYCIGNGLGTMKEIPEFAVNDQQLVKEFEKYVGVSFRPYSKHPLYVKAEYLARLIRIVDEFTKFAVLGIYRPSVVIDGLSQVLQYRIEIFSELAVTVIKWLTAHLSENRNVFVDYLSNEEKYYEVYVELVQFIHEYLTEQDNTAKFEL